MVFNGALQHKWVISCCLPSEENFLQGNEKQYDSTVHKFIQVITKNGIKTREGNDSAINEYVLLRDGDSSPQVLRLGLSKRWTPCISGLTCLIMIFIHHKVRSDSAQSVKKSINRYNTSHLPQLTFTQTTWLLTIIPTCLQKPHGHHSTKHTYTHTHTLILNGRQRYQAMRQVYICQVFMNDAVRHVTKMKHININAETISFLAEWHTETFQNDTVN